MSLISDFRERAAILCSGNNSGEKRLFAGLEIVCQPVSFLCILAIPALPVLKRFGYEAPEAFTAVAFPVLLSASIGYLTNWLAIEMLFKPYKRTLRHPFAWLTLGYWKQGLVPKNKAKIAETIGDTVETQLLKPEDLAVDLSSLLWTFLGDRAQMRACQLEIAAIVKTKALGIRQAIQPKLEETLAAELKRLCAPENVRKLWNTRIEPRLLSEEARGKMAAVIIQAIDKHAPEISEHLRPQLISILAEYCMEKGGPMFGPMLVKMVDGLADRIISQENIASFIKGWLDNPDTMPALRNDLTMLVTGARDYMMAPEALADISSFASEARAGLKEELAQWLDNGLLPMLTNMLESQELTDDIIAMLAECRPQLEDIIRTRGIPAIKEKLKVRERIKDAVDRQDMQQFHAMINGVAAQHLGAIQVLGFILGGIVGALTHLLV